MRNTFPKVVLAIAAMALLASATMAQTPIHTNLFAFFYDSLSTYNGQPAPVGSIIRAYDPQNVLIGIDTVGFDPTAPAGYYGSMASYGDDSNTPLVDEGAVTGDTIHFTINGRAATVVAGDPVWADRAVKRASLAADAVVIITMVAPPADTVVAPNHLVQIRVGVRNDGNGIDFYRVTAQDSDTAYHTVREDTLLYADVDQTVYATFDIQVPMWGTTPGDTLNVISYVVRSRVDTSKFVSGTLSMFMSVTDVPDHGTRLPGGFALYQNYPNPFNPSTTISYSLPRSSSVQFEVFDVLGRVVDGRNFGEQSAGPHEFEYDGSNLSSGVYFYRVTTSAGAESRKMLLLK